MANTLDSFRNGAVGFIDWLDRTSCISPSVGGDRKRGTTNHSLLGLPTAMRVAQNIIFFQPLTSLSVGRQEKAFRAVSRILTRHKVSDRETCKALAARSGRMTNTQST